MADPNLGLLRSAATYNPDLLTGFGKRLTNWEFSAAVDREILPRVSAEVGYFRRWFYGFLVTDNLAVTAADFDRFSLTAPKDPRLPDGGGQVIPDLFN
jgi:hypothetical protein